MLKLLTSERHSPQSNVHTIQLDLVFSITFQLDLVFSTRLHTIATNENSLNSLAKLYYTNAD